MCVAHESDVSCLIVWLGHLFLNVFELTDFIAMHLRYLGSVDFDNPYQTRGT